MAKIKRLFAIHTDAFGKTYRTKIAEGTTGDFGTPVGFQIEEFEEILPRAANENEAGSESLGLAGSYPAMISGDHSNLEGKLLTMCDATFTNKEQREAFKSMVKETLWVHFTNLVAATEGTYQFSELNRNTQWQSKETKN